MLNITRIKVGTLDTNCYLISSSDEIAVIDPGDESDLIFNELKKTGKKIKYIIITHYHFDHTTDSDKLRGLTKAVVLTGENEKDFVKYEVDKYVKEGDEIKIGEDTLTVINTPGHSEGSICLMGENFIFTGDTLFRNGFGRTDLKGGDEKKMEESLKKLSKIIKPGMMIYPGHGDYFNIMDY